LREPRTRNEHRSSVMAENVPSSVKFHYRKAKFFKVIHVDGVIGGPTPERAVFVALYNQRSPIPRVVEQAISADGSLGAEIKREGKDGIFREVEVGIVLTSKAALEIGQFLLQQAKLLRDTEQEAPGKTSAASEEHDEHFSTRSS
jgi:hypothetical protein